VPCIQQCNKYWMIKKCSSANRCARVDCYRCARRYARRIARDFQRHDPGRIYAVTTNARVTDLDGFAKCRVAIWNVIAYRRQISRWWNGVSTRLWQCHDGSIRGVMALGSISEAEILKTIGARWPITLRRIEPDALSHEIWEATRPDMIMADDPDLARYQPRQMTVRPRRTRATSRGSSYVPPPNPFDEPMPFIIG
jgi:hypothetical protein